MIETGGGRFDPAQRPVYFVAIGEGQDMGINAIKPFLFDWVLAAVTPGLPVEKLRKQIGYSTRLLLDSGAFSIAAAHMRKHGLSMNEALSTPPERLDGFKRLRESYVELVKATEPDLWGYMEIDLGSTDVKRETRAELEAEGLRPIPVYTPLNDGWDYLDELLDGYDRIGVGGLVGMPVELRKRILVTVWERARRAPWKPWIHVLGYTPAPLFMACPFDSCDSSKHLYSLRYGSAITMGRAMLGSFSALNDAGFSYDQSERTDVDRGGGKLADLLGFIAEGDHRCWDRALADLDEVLGVELGVYPAVLYDELDPRPAA